MSPRPPAKSTPELDERLRSFVNSEEPPPFSPPTRRASAHDLTDDAAPVATPQASLERHGKTWAVIIAMIMGAMTIVNLGVSIGRRNSEYATVGELTEIKDDQKKTNAALVELKLTTARIEQMLTDNKASEVKPIADQASKNALDAQAKAAKAQEGVDMIKRSIAGFNASEARRGHATPLPLQDDR